MNICTNNVPRETVCYWDISAKDQEGFDYLAEDEMWDYRLFKYRGEYYDYYEFDYVNPEYPAYRKLHSLGWHGVQSQSAGSILWNYPTNIAAITVNGRHATWSRFTERHGHAVFTPPPSGTLTYFISSRRDTQSTVKPR